jgi:hypothetical protein
MCLWTIYRRPSDYPNSIVARLFLIEADGPKMTNRIINAQVDADVANVVFNDIADRLLEKVRTLIGTDKDYPAYYRMARDAEDDPTIIEVWL